jgi:hypothetical protein
VGVTKVSGKCEEAMREVLGAARRTAYRQARLRHRRWRQRREERRGGEQRAMRRAMEATDYARKGLIIELSRD